MKTLSLLVALILTPLVTGAGFEDETVDFESILTQARERYELEETDLANITVEELLDSQHFLRLQLGAWDIRLPIHELTDRTAAVGIQDAVGRTLDVAAIWAEWTLTEEVALEESLADIAVLQKWVKGWSNRVFKKAIKAEGETLLERMASADDKVRAAAERLRKRQELPQAIAGREPAQIVFIPTRRTFAELVVLAGAIEPERKKVLWDKDAVFGTAAWSDNVHFVALEYATWPWRMSDPFSGDEMNKVTKTGRAQHCVERAATSLSRGAFNSFSSPLLEQALHINMVVKIIGGDYPTFDSWSFQFSRAGGSTAPYSRFVPGGNSAGGTLPARPAKAGATTGSSSGNEKSVWRENDGSDYFLEALNRGQKKGLKLAGRNSDVPPALQRDKLAHFAIGILGKSSVTLMSAPFLGDVADDKKAPPDEYVDEYEEFFRSYRACFVHWLQTQGNPNGEAESFASFSKLLSRAGSRGADDTLSSMVAEVYGLPLSAENGETDNLEWRFLTYVSKGR